MSNNYRHIFTWGYKICKFGKYLNFWPQKLGFLPWQNPGSTPDSSLMSQGVHVFPWKVLGPGDDNSESINTLKVYCP